MTRLSTSMEGQLVPELLFLAGVPATGKSWLGSWLAETHGYVHMDAERDGGRDFHTAGIHTQWERLIQTGWAAEFVQALATVNKPVVLNWGFPTRFLHVTDALKAAGMRLVWLTGERVQARAAFVRRGGIDPRLFDQQMDFIERDWPHITRVFAGGIVPGLHTDGSQRHPENIWQDIAPLR
jgi:hypothetical protein